MCLYISYIAFLTSKNTTQIVEKNINARYNNEFWCLALQDGLKAIYFED